MPRGYQTSPLGSLTMPGPLYSVHVLQVGFNLPNPDGSARADGSVTLLSGGPLTVLVDTGGPWLRAHLPKLLAERGVTPEEVTHVVVTHGHSDHVGNVNLFPRATLLVGFDLSAPGGLYLPHGLARGAPLVLHPGHLEVTPTPGHTRAHVSLVALGTSLGTVAVAGDAFEREGDEGEWGALSEDPPEQRRSRRRLVALADVIVPGHGEPFRVVREWGEGRRGTRGGGTRGQQDPEEEEEEEEGTGGGGTRGQRDIEEEEEEEEGTRGGGTRGHWDIEEEEEEEEGTRGGGTRGQWDIEEEEEGTGGGGTRGHWDIEEEGTGGGGTGGQWDLEEEEEEEEGTRGGGTRGQQDLEEEEEEGLGGGGTRGQQDPEEEEERTAGGGSRGHWDIENEGTGGGGTRGQRDLEEEEEGTGGSGTRGQRDIVEEEEEEEGTPGGDTEGHRDKAGGGGH